MPVNQPPGIRAGERAPKALEQESLIPADGGIGGLARAVLEGLVVQLRKSQ